MKFTFKSISKSKNLKLTIFSKITGNFMTNIITLFIRWARLFDVKSIIDFFFFWATHFFHYKICTLAINSAFIIQLVLHLNCVTLQITPFYLASNSEERLFPFFAISHFLLLYRLLWYFFPLFTIIPNSVIINSKTCFLFVLLQLGQITVWVN